MVFNFEVHHCLLLQSHIYCTDDGFNCGSQYWKLTISQKSTVNKATSDPKFTKASTLSLSKPVQVFPAPVLYTFALSNELTPKSVPQCAVFSLRPLAISSVLLATAEVDRPIVLLPCQLAAAKTSETAWRTVFCLPTLTVSAYSRFSSLTYS